MVGRGLGVKRHIARWRETGLIDARTAEALLDDVGQHGLRRWRMADALGIMAGVLVGAAILIFVAANWDAVPRLARVIGLFAVIAAGYIGGAVLRIRGHEWSADACWIVAACGFGASIALISQMYHLSGDERGAVLLWSAGTALAAVVLRSGPLTVMACLLASGWMMLSIGARFGGWSDLLIWPGLAALLYGLSIWTDSPKSRHIILFSLTVFACLIAWQTDSTIAPMLLCSISLPVFVFAHFRAKLAKSIFGIGGWIPFHALLAFLSGIWTLQWQWAESSAFLFASILALVAIVAAIATEGRHDKSVRRLAYAGFLLQIFFIYAIMIATMLGTAGFFLLAGFVLAGLAFASTRMEKTVRNGQGRVGQ